MILGQLDTAAIAEADGRAVVRTLECGACLRTRIGGDPAPTCVDRLAEECALAGKDELFGQLNSHLSVTSESAAPYEELALRLGRPITTCAAMSPGCVEIPRDFAKGSARHGGRNVRGRRGTAPSLRGPGGGLIQ